MSKIIASVVIAALLLGGAASTVPTEPAPAVTPTESAVQTLTAEDAQAIALEMAGLIAADVTAIRSEWDMENGRQEYEVEFRSGDWEYDYTVDALSGEVIEQDKEYEPAPTQPPATEPAPSEPAPTEPAPTEPAPTQPPATEPAATQLTEAEAIAIALAHAGLTADQIKGLQTELDLDERVPEWEVEFHVGRTEYEYTIHAETGKILEWDQEWDD